MQKRVVITLLITTSFLILAEVYLFGQRGQQSNFEHETEVRGPEAREERGQDLPEKYRLIIKDNLFRPLGYEEPREEVGYRLVGIVSNSNENNENNENKALIVESNGNSYYVKVGDRIGNAVVAKILDKQVVLIRDGKPIELRLEEMQFMSSPNLAPPSGEGKSQQPTPPSGGAGGQPGGTGLAVGASGSGTSSEKEVNKRPQQSQEQIRREVKVDWDKVKEDWSRRY